MSNRFVVEAYSEYNATLNLIEGGDYTDINDLHKLKEYAAALKVILTHIDPPIPMKEEK